MVILISSCNYKPVTKEDLMEVSYRKGWVEGANAAVDAINNGENFNKTADEKFKKDSLAFVGLIK